MTGRVTLLTAGAFDELCNPRDRPIVDTPRGLTIPDTGDEDGRAGFAAALVTRTIANPFSGTAI